MKHIMLMVVMAVVVVSCSGEAKKDERPAKSSGEIVDKYVETLKAAKPKAREAAEATEKSNRAKENAIKEMDAK